MTGLLGAIKQNDDRILMAIIAANGLLLGISDGVDGDGTMVGAAGYIVAGFAIGFLWMWSR